MFINSRCCRPPNPAAAAAPLLSSSRQPVFIEMRQACETRRRVEECTPEKPDRLYFEGGLGALMSPASLDPNRHLGILRSLFPCHRKKKQTKKEFLMKRATVTCQKTPEPVCHHLTAPARPAALGMYIIPICSQWGQIYICRF